MIIDQYDDNGRMLAALGGRTKLASHWPEPTPDSEGWYAHPEDEKFPVNTPRNTAASVFYYAAQHDHPNMGKEASRILRDAVAFHKLGSEYLDLLKLAEGMPEGQGGAQDPRTREAIMRLIAQRRLVAGKAPQKMQQADAEDEDIKYLTQGLQEKEAEQGAASLLPDLPVDLMDKVIGFVKNRSADVAELKRRAQDTVSDVIKSAGIDLTQNLVETPSEGGLAQGKGDVHYYNAKKDRPDDPQFVDDAEFKFRESKRPIEYVYRGDEVYRLSWDDYRNIVWDKLDNIQAGNAPPPKDESSTQEKKGAAYDFSSLEASPQDRLITRLKQALVGGGLGLGAGVGVKKLLARKGRDVPTSLIPALAAFGTGAGLFRKAGEAIEDAVSRYEDDRHSLNPMERRKYAKELRKLAEAASVEMPVRLRNESSDTFRRDFSFRATFRKEAASSFSDGKYLPAYEGLFKMAEDLGPEQFASALYELDGRTGMASRWGYVEDPVEITFGHNPAPPETIEINGEPFHKEAFANDDLYEGLTPEYSHLIREDPSRAIPELAPEVQDLILSRLR